MIMFHRKTWSCLFLGLLVSIFLLWNHQTVLADELVSPCILTGEDVGNGFEYSAPGVGTFSINGMDGSTMKTAIFDLPESIFPVLYLNGSTVPFNDGMIMDNGSYELHLYPTAELTGDHCIFTFEIQNDYEDLLPDKREVPVVEQPPLVVEYNVTNRMFRYTLPDHRYFEITVPMGGWSRSQVEVKLSAGLKAYQIYLDGELIYPETDDLIFNRTGSYELIIWDNEMGMDGDVSYKISLPFHLYLNDLMTLSHINAPYGFSIDSVILDGKEIPAGGTYYHMTRDGVYDFKFRIDGGEGSWNMRLRRDTTPPYLIFNRYTDGEILKKDIHFSASEPGASVSITRNGVDVISPANDIVISGIYHMEIADKAGNSREYDFEVDTGYIRWNKSLLIIPLVLLIAAGGAFAYWKKDLKVL